MFGITTLGIASVGIFSLNTTGPVVSSNNPSPLLLPSPKTPNTFTQMYDRVVFDWVSVSSPFGKKYLPAGGTNFTIASSLTNLKLFPVNDPTVTGAFVTVFLKYPVVLVELEVALTQSMFKLPIEILGYLS